MEMFEDDLQEGSDTEAESMTAAEVLKTLEEVRISDIIAHNYPSLILIMSFTDRNIKIIKLYLH